MAFQLSPLIAFALVVASPAAGQSLNASITVSNLIGCWDRQPSEGESHRDETDGFADTFEVCFDEAGAVETFSLGGDTKYGVEGWGDVFTYALADRLTFLSEGVEDSSCLVRLADDVLELHGCRGSYFDDGTFQKVSETEQIKSLFAF